MERCELSITTPSADNAYPLVIPSAPIQIYNIAHKKRLYGDSLSYINRPHRGGLIGEPHLERNSSWSHNFTCLMEEIYTFEVACGTGECSLGWTQDKEHGHFPGGSVSDTCQSLGRLLLTTRSNIDDPVFDNLIYYDVIYGLSTFFFRVILPISLPSR